MAAGSSSFLPHRAGTAAAVTPEGEVTLSNPDGRQVPVTSARRQLWELLDGQRDVPALARALGWSTEKVWSELDALADDGLLQRRVAPPAGGMGLSRRRMLRRSLPALALTMPGYAMAQNIEQSGKAAAEASAKIGEQTDKSIAAEQDQKAAGQQEALSKAAELQSKQNSELTNKQQESTGKFGEAFQKASQEQGIKSQEIAIKAGSGPGGTTAVPEPTTLALLGVAGAAAYLGHHLRERSEAAASAPERPAAPE